MRKLILAGLLLALLLAACSPAATPTPAPVAPTPPLTEEAGMPTPPGAAATQPPIAGGLTLDQLKNMPYQLLNASTPRPVTLSDGGFTSPDPASPDYVRARLLDNVAFTDLDGDGKPDAAVLLAENYGGTGNFVSLIAMLNRDGQPRQDASVYIDDRPHINALTAENGVITLDVVVHGPGDPMCCAAQRKVMTFTLTQAGLTAQKVTSFTPDGSERSITIESPAEGAAVLGSVQLSGSFTISPFENTLAYRLYDATGAELAAGPITVSAAEMGGPGTFDITIDLSAIPAGSPDRIAVQDISAADGSIIAMDSVNVTVK
jgi:hypothetical protein